MVAFFFFLNDPAPTEISPLSLHAALPIYSDHSRQHHLLLHSENILCTKQAACHRSEEHTSELQSQSNSVCRLLLEKKLTAGIPSLIAFFSANRVATPIRTTNIRLDGYPRR